MSPGVILYVGIYVYEVSQEKCAAIRYGVRYVKFYRYNPIHLCLKLELLRR